MSHASPLDYRVRKVQGWLASVIHRILFQQQQTREDGRKKKSVFNKESFQHLNTMAHLIKGG